MPDPARLGALRTRRTAPTQNPTARCSLCEQNLAEPSFCADCGAIFQASCVEAAGCVGCRREGTGASMANRPQREPSILDQDATPLVLVALLGGSWISSSMMDGPAWFPLTITVIVLGWAAQYRLAR